jgi:hypothetical protein
MMLSLPASISSRQDLKAVIMELQRYGQWASQTAIKQRVVNQSPAGQPVLSAGAGELIKQWQADEKTAKAGLDKLIEALENFAAKAPFVTVTLAAPAPTVLRQAIVDWFRKNVRADLLVDFQFNGTMLGGMAIRYGSRVFDWSFKRQILANRAKFAEILRHV